ncbi:MAG: FtsX-like permease family protein [Elusimicrobia bacterium]|nr:FtsX-like permease family protein [Elusimicrobiota bacterium]
MPFELFVALRYLKAKRKGLFAVITTSIGISGVAVGVTALLTTLSVMNGFQTDIQKKIIGAQSHLTIYGQMDEKEARELKQILAGYKEVAASSPFLLGQAILSYRGRSIGVILKGLDPQQEPQVNELHKSVIQGRWELGKNDLILGKELAKNLNIGLGAQLLLISPQEIATPLGTYPKMQKFKVTGMLHTGYYEFDNTMAYTSLSSAHAFLGHDSASGLQVKLQNLYQAPKVSREIQQKVGWKYTVRTFSQMNQTLFAALKLEKIVMFIILTLIVLVAALNIASNLILLSTEKVRDMGVLRALGATPRTISKIFWWEGSLIGICGIGLGLGLGLLLCWIIAKYPIVELPGDIYYLTRVPVSVQVDDILWICLGSFGLCLLATLYPVLRTSRIPPAESIRYG